MSEVSYWNTVWPVGSLVHFASDLWPISYAKRTTKTYRLGLFFAVCRYWS